MRLKRPSGGSQKQQFNQRLRLRRKLVFVITGSFSLLLVAGVVIYFQLAYVKQAHAASDGDYRAVASGNWNSTSTWQKYSGGWGPAATTPTSADGVIEIQSTYTVIITAAVTADQVVIDAGGEVDLNTGITLTVANGTGTDLDVSGTFKNAGSVTINSSASIVYENGGKYQHNYTTTAGTIPTATWSTGATCEIVGYTTYSGLPGNMQTFYNFKWNCTNQTSTPDFSGGLSNFTRDFTIASTGTGVIYMDFQGNNSSLTIGGNFNIQGGTTYLCVNGSTTVTLNNGNLNVTGGTLAFNSGVGTAYGNTSAIVTVNGNVTVTNGTLDLSQCSANNTSKGVGQLYLTGNLSVSGTGFITESGNSKGKIYFNGTSIQTFSSNRQITNVIDYIVNANAIVRMDTSIATGDGTFTLNSTAGLMMGHSGGITQTSANGNVQCTDTRSFSTGADYTYEGTAAQVSGDGLPSQVRNLTLNNASNCTLTSNTSASGTMTFTSGLWIATNDTLTLGINTSTLGTLSYTSGYVVGYFKRWLAATTATNILFPIGSMSNYEGLNFTWTIAPTTAGALTTLFVGSNPGKAGFNLWDSPDSLVNIGAQYWTATPANSFSGGTFSLDITATALQWVSNYAKLHVIRRNSSAVNWSVNGSNAAGTGSNSVPIAHRTGMTLYNHLAIASPSVNILPIELISFTAKANNNVVELKWVTATEINNDYFTIERSADNKNYEEVLRKQGAGNSSSAKNYIATDDTPLSGVSYYRLLQTDYDGKTVAFPPKAVSLAEKSENNTSSFNIKTIGPNPFKDSFTVNYNSAQQGDLQIQIINQAGQVIYKETVNADKGFNTYSFTDNQNLAPGIYFVNLISNGEAVTKKLVKN